MLMKALDTLHVSAAGPDNIQVGQTFEINDSDGQILQQRGLAVPVDDEPKPAPKALAKARA